MNQAPTKPRSFVPPPALAPADVAPPDKATQREIARRWRRLKYQRIGNLIAVVLTAILFIAWCFKFTLLRLLAG